MLYRIGLFSKLSRTTIKTLRYYDESGLLRPAQIDAESGYRYYSTEQLFQLHEIVALRQMGCSIAEISAILDGRQVEEVLLERQHSLTQQMQEIAGQLSRINHYRMNRKEGLMMQYQPIVKEIPACTVFSRRLTISGYADLMRVWPETGQLVAQLNPDLRCIEPDYCFNIYHDGEYKEAEVDIEICQAVERAGIEGNGICFKDMPPVTVVSVLHRGAYENLRQAYAFLLQWLEDNGYQLAGQMRECYIDGIWNQDSEAQWLTEIQAPVTK